MISGKKLTEKEDHKTTNDYKPQLYIICAFIYDKKRGSFIHNCWFVIGRIQIFKYRGLFPTDIKYLCVLHNLSDILMQYE